MAACLRMGVAMRIGIKRLSASLRTEVERLPHVLA